MYFGWHTVVISRIIHNKTIKLQHNSLFYLYQSNMFQRFRDNHQVYTEILTHCTLIMVPYN
jgi:hypothetical protein